MAPLAGKPTERVSHLNADRPVKLPEPLRAEQNLRWSAFTAAADKKNLTIDFKKPVIQATRHAFVLSDFIFKTCTRKPALLIDLVASEELFIQYPPGRYVEKIAAGLTKVTTETELSFSLRKHRAREMVRIAFRDINRIADLDETMSDLSAFADGCLQKALEQLYTWQCAKFGEPFAINGGRQKMIVMAMGKLGARELNFSSDIDLIFTFPEKGETRGQETVISCDDFFTRLAQKLIKVIGANTAEGFVFRVDTRLRPFGDNGPIVMSFDAMEDYYQFQGREWERYAWIKARPVAGDSSAGTALMERLQPFIYRRYLDYGVFDSLRQMKQSISPGSKA